MSGAVHHRPADVVALLRGDHPFQPYPSSSRSVVGIGVSKIHPAPCAVTPCVQRWIRRHQHQDRPRPAFCETETLREGGPMTDTDQPGEDMDAERREYEAARDRAQEELRRLQEENQERLRQIQEDTDRRGRQRQEEINEQSRRTQEIEERRRQIQEESARRLQETLEEIERQRRRT